MTRCTALRRSHLHGAVCMFRPMSTLKSEDGPLTGVKVVSLAINLPARPRLPG